LPHIGIHRFWGKEKRLTGFFTAEKYVELVQN